LLFAVGISCILPLTVVKGVLIVFVKNENFVHKQKTKEVFV